MIGVSFAIEDRFGLVLDADAFAGCENLRDVVEMIQAKGRAAGSPA